MQNHHLERSIRFYQLQKFWNPREYPKSQEYLTGMQQRYKAGDAIYGDARPVQAYLNMLIDPTKTNNQYYDLLLSVNHVCVSKLMNFIRKKSPLKSKKGKNQGNS